MNQELYDYLHEHDFYLNKGEFRYCTDKYGKDFYLNKGVSSYYSTVCF